MIRPVSENEISLVRHIAEVTWPVAFGQILSAEQLAYMMDMMYQEDVLKKQLRNGHEFYLFMEEGKALGFMGLEANYQHKPQLKIHKLYILPEHQGKKIGEKFIRFAEERARTLKQSDLTLNVNRFNNALYFYEKLGFINKQSIDIEIGNGYLMEDYILEKHLPDHPRTTNTHNVV